MDNHARHAAESRKIHEARNAIPGSPLWDRLVAAGEIVEAPEVAANHGLFADSGGAYDE